MLIIIYHWSTWLAWCLNLYITTKHHLLVECNELTFHYPSLNPFMFIDYLPDLCHNDLIVFISNKHNPQHYSWILSSLASSWIPVTCCDIPNQDLLLLPDRWSAPHWVPYWQLTPHYSGTFSCLFALSIEQVFHNSNSKGRMAPWGFNETKERWANCESSYLERCTKTKETSKLWIQLSQDGAKQKRQANCGALKQEFGDHQLLQ